MIPIGCVAPLRSSRIDQRQRRVWSRITLMYNGSTSSLSRLQTARRALVMPDVNKLNHSWTVILRPYLSMLRITICQKTCCFFVMQMRCWNWLVRCLKTIRQNISCRKKGQKLWVPKTMEHRFQIKHMMLPRATLRNVLYNTLSTSTWDPTFSTQDTLRKWTTDKLDSPVITLEDGASSHRQNNRIRYETPKTR